MSYKQIFRRTSRILKSKLNDAVDSILSDRNELDEFEKELRKSKTQNQQQHGQQKQSSNTSQQQNQRQQTKPPRPGEKTDEECLTILGLTADASPQQIKDTYKKLMGQYHPDKVASLGVELQELANKKTKEINEAYQVLKKRKNY